MTPKDEKDTQKLFGKIFRMLLEGELPAMMTASTATFVMGILRLLLELLRIAFPGRKRRPRKEVGSPPKT